MPTAISSANKTALVAAAKVIRERISSALLSYQASADVLRGLAGITALPQAGNATVLNGLASFRSRLAGIRDEGLRMVAPILVDMGREAGATVVNGETVASWPELFRKINTDLLGGTPDYIDPRAVSFASNPAVSAKGIFRRLVVDHNGEPLEGGYHNQTKRIRIVSKPARWQSIAEIRGADNNDGDVLDYRGGRPAITAGLSAVNDASPPPGSVLNPSLRPGDTTDEADIASIASWTINTTGSPVFKAEATAANLWRGQAYAARFRGDNTTAIELVQYIPAAVLANGYRPWDLGIPIKLESGWEGDIVLTWGGKSQSFDETNLSAGAYKLLHPDLDADLFPVNFDATGAQYKLKFTNSQNNSASIWIAGFLPYGMIAHEGIWYSHYSDVTEPEVNDEVTLADTCSFTGRIADVIAFLFQDVAPGWAHLPTSGATTINDPTWAPEIGITRNGANVADEGTIALGTVTASTEHFVTLRIANTGDGPLAIGVPVDNGGPTNATLTTAGLSVPASIAPGEYVDVTVGVTDGGAGAFSLTIRIDNNDASEGTYELTISGTAA